MSAIAVKKTNQSTIPKTDNQTQNLQLVQASTGHVIPELFLHAITRVKQFQNPKPFPCFTIQYYVKTV